MKQNSLSTTGLSMSQAQSISNLCNQRAREIDIKLDVNNFSKKIKVDNVEHVIVPAKPIPTNVVDLLHEKARLYACQAFLRENMKMKEESLENAKKEVCDIKSVQFPEEPKREVPKLEKEVGEEYGWEQLTTAELNEYWEAEAFASTIGKFIHQDGTLDNLRIGLPGVPTIDWMTVKDGEKTPVTVSVHHTSEQLMEIHEKLATLHRQYEQRVNYFKAKVKNLTTTKNSQIAKENADRQSEAEVKNNEATAKYTQEYNAAAEKVKTLRAEFEKIRQENIKEIASKRIIVDPRFQPVIDEFLQKLDSTK